MTSGLLIQLRGVSKAYPARRGRRWALANFDLDVADGERIAVVGPNGSGKTTLLRVALGIESPDTGTVSIRGGLTRNVVSYVPQDYRNALFPWMRLRSNLALVNNAQSGSGRLCTDAYAELSDLVKLRVDLSKFPYELSGGEQQIFVLLRALVANPTLLVLDEPLSAVDFGRKQLIQQYLASWLHGRTTTLLFASHDFLEAVLLSDRVVVLERDSGQVQTTVAVELPWPRTLEMRDRPEFRTLVDEIMAVLL